MVMSAAIAAGASIAGGAIASKGAKDAAKTQAGAAKEASEIDRAAAAEAAGIQTGAITKAVDQQQLSNDQVRNVALDQAAKIHTAEGDALGRSAQTLIQSANTAQKQYEDAVMTGDQARINATRDAAQAAIASRDSAVAKYQASIDQANTGYREATKTGQGMITGARDASNLTLKEMYDKGVAGFDPYMTAGKNAVTTMDAGMVAGGDFNRNFNQSDFVKDGGYDFRLNEGTRNLENSALARGGLLSGDALRGVTEYGQGFASNEYDKAYGRWSKDIGDRFTRLSDLAGTGLTATSGAAALGQTYGQNVSTNNMSAADKTAGLELGMADWTGKNTMAGGQYAAGQEIAKGDISAGSIRDVGNIMGNQATTIGGSRADTTRDVGNITAGQIMGQGQSNIDYFNSADGALKDYYGNQGKIASGGTLAIGNAQAAGKTGAANAISTGIRDAGNATSAGQATSAQNWNNALNSAANTFTTFTALNSKKKQPGVA